MRRTLPVALCLLLGACAERTMSHRARTAPDPHAVAEAPAAAPLRTATFALG